MVRPNRNREDPAFARSLSRLSNHKKPWPSEERQARIQKLDQTFCAPVLPAQAKDEYKEVANFEVSNESESVPPRVKVLVPNLEGHLLKEEGVAPSPFNHAFHHDRDPGVYRSEDWTDNQQRIFNKYWDPKCGNICNALIERHEYLWCWLIPREFSAGAPHVEEGLRSNHIIAGHRMDQVLIYGSYRHVRKLRTWPSPQPMACAICGRTFPPETLSPWMLNYFGQRRYCPECCCRAINGCANEDITSAMEALVGLASVTGYIPNKNFRRELCIGAIPEQERDLILAWSILVPNSETIEKLFPGPWLKVLQDCGIVGNARLTSRGYQSFAKDGHFCRSLAERSIDDFFHTNGIAHEPEPNWPKHLTLNPAGLMRADWELQDGTFVEYAGMMNDDEYASKMQRKRLLALETDINLIVLIPEDLPHLGSIFRGWFPD